jgi:hypothetical protein
MQAALAILAGLVVAGAATPHDTAGAEVSLGVAARSSDPDRVVAGSVVGELRVREVWLSFKDLRFEEQATCEQGGTAQVAGPITVELVGGTAAGMPERVALPATRYCAVELTLRRSRGKSDDAPLALRGHSILIRAARADGTAVVLRSRLDRTLRLAAVDPDGFELAAERARLILAGDLARWLGELDLDVADVSADGERPVIKIDARHNRELLRGFEERVAAGLGLYRGGDDDAAPLAAGG